MSISIHSTFFEEMTAKANLLNEIKDLTDWHQEMRGEAVHLRMKAQSALLDDIEALLIKYTEMGEWV